MERTRCTALVCVERTPSCSSWIDLDVAMGKTIVLQLPVPQESTVALLKKLGGKEGPGPRGARPPVAP